MPQSKTDNSEINGQGRQGLSARSDDFPFVSVIMPVRNEADFIERSLGAVMEQDYPHARMEIIVADGNSADGTRALIEEMSKRSEIAVRIVDNPELTAPFALNRAIADTRGEIIVRVDGHCEIEKDYVSNCVRHLRCGKAEAVGGPIETIGRSAKARAISVAMSSSFGVGGSAFRCVKDREMYVDTVAFPAYGREILRKAGPFREELVRNQDDEFNYRIRKMGGRILLAPDIRSKYYSRSTFRSLWRQYFQYGYWKVRVFQLHPKQMSYRQFVPAVFVAALIGTLVLDFFAGSAWPTAAVVLLYSLAAIAAAVRLGSRLSWSEVPLLLASFPILHLSYGLGFLAALYSLRDGWRRPRTKTAEI
jgi:glycosyltransferase involved in cell wall biosynthesis